MWFLGTLGGVPMSSSHDLCALHFVGFVSYQASDWWLRCPKASSYADSGPFTQLDRCFWDGLKYPFSFLLLQFGTGIAVDRFQGQQEGGRCVGHKHSMKDLEPWLMWEATWSWSWRYSLSQQKKQWKLRWNPVPKVSSDSEFPHLLLVELVFHDGYHMFQLSCYHPTSATAGSLVGSWVARVGLKTSWAWPWMMWSGFRSGFLGACRDATNVLIRRDSWWKLPSASWKFPKFFFLHTLDEMKFPFGCWISWISWIINS